MPGMNGRKINQQQKALLRELRRATSLTCLCHPVERTRKTGDLLSRFTESFATRDLMEASANDRVIALSPAKSSRQIVFLMLGAFALFQQEPKIKKCAGSEI